MNSNEQSGNNTSSQAGDKKTLQLAEAAGTVKEAGRAPLVLVDSCSLLEEREEVGAS